MTRRKNPQTVRKTAATPVDQNTANITKDNTTTAPATKEIGQPGLALSNFFVDQLKKDDLKIPNRWCTFDQMVEDSSVSQPLKLTQCLETIGLSHGFYEATGTRKSKVIADFLNYNLHNMEDLAWLEAVSNINTDVQYGFSLNEVVLRKETSGPYKNSYTLRRLGPRSPKSIYAWLWDEEVRGVKGIIQKPLKIVDNTFGPMSNEFGGYLSKVPPSQYTKESYKYPVISSDKLLHIKYDGSMSNPEGNSPLVPCYAPWKEKKVISEYQIIGITRDFGGIPVARVPSALMERANDVEHKYPSDERAYQDFQTQLANMHAGRQAYFILSSDLAEGSTSLYDYDLELLGVQGNGKQFDISEITKAKDTEIYNAFGAGYLILGQSGNTSSYNLSTTGQNTHSFFIERDLIYKADVLKNKLAPLILKANNIDFQYKDLPEFKYKDPDQLSLDEGFKAIQRGKSVGALTPNMLEELARKMNLPTDGIDDLDFTDPKTSRAGEGMGTSGTGTTDQQNSDTNLENKQLNKDPLNLVQDGPEIYDRDSGEFIGYMGENSGT